MATTARGVAGVLVSKVTIWLAFDSPKAVIAAAGAGRTPRKQVRIAASGQRARSRTGGWKSGSSPWQLLRSATVHGFASDLPGWLAATIGLTGAA